MIVVNSHGGFESTMQNNYDECINKLEGVIQWSLGPSFIFIFCLQPVSDFS